MNNLYLNEDWAVLLPIAIINLAANDYRRDRARRRKLAGGA